MPCSSERNMQIFFEANGRNRHRSLVVLVGEEGRMQIPTIHRTLLRCTQGTVDTIVWCHKNEVTKKISKEASRKKQKNLQTDEAGDALSIFLKANEVDFVEYKESEKLLGQTVDMLVLQDFEALSPNLIATSMETVRGGGVIVLLLDTVNTIEALISRRTDIHAEVADAESIVPRYNKRLFRSLTDSGFVLFLDDQLVSLEIGSADVSSIHGSADAELLSPENGTDALRDLGRTADQKAVIDEIFSMLETRTNRAVCSITAPRGRGKSAALGISIARAIEMGLATVYVASPALENVKAVFQFVAIGLEKLGYKKYVDFKIIYQFRGNKRLVHRIEFARKRKQIVEYFDPFTEMKYCPDLLVVDEAAAIPMTFLLNLMFPSLIVMATTISGYEGTGRSFSVKLSEHLRKNSVETSAFAYKELNMKSCIRYGQNDPVESWLNRVLLLEISVPKIEGCPNPGECGLFYVDRNSLFSGRSASERFLKDAFSLFVSSHYKNSPNDLQILADSPRHELFTLLTPVEDNGREMPSVMCSIQVSFEGRCRKTEGSREGNLIPWIVSEEQMDPGFLEAYGARIVRIAVHPEYVGMGYGGRALTLLIDFLSRQTGNIGYSVENRDRCEDNVLLYDLDDLSAPRLDWIGASFGVTERLHGFWSRSRLLPVGVKQTVTQATGDHSGIFLRPVGDTECPRIEQYNQTFRSRFVGLLSCSFKHFSPSLSLSLLHASKLIPNCSPTTYFSPSDVSRLKAASRGRIDMALVADLIPDVSRMYFHGRFSKDLSVLRRSVLLMAGCQHKDAREVADILSLKPFQILNILAKVLEILIDELEERYTSKEQQ